MPTTPRAEPLDAAREALIDLSAALGTRRAEAVRDALGHAARTAPAAHVDEALLQSHLFVGFPLALEAITAWREIGGHNAPAGQEPPDAGPRRGPRVCAAVYGYNYDRLRRNVATLHPDLDRWMVEHGYGRVLGRPGLDLATRELCVVALLATWDAPRQLHSHLRGALHADASPAEVTRAVELACGHLSPAAAQRVRALWDRVRG